VRGELLARLGRVDEAVAELARAAELCPNPRERSLLEQKIGDLVGRPGPGGDAPETGE
jgi:predicted RNA polymerase sigma factor